MLFSLEAVILACQGRSDGGYIGIYTLPQISLPYKCATMVIADSKDIINCRTLAFVSSLQAGKKLVKFEQMGKYSPKDRQTDRQTPGR